MHGITEYVSFTVRGQSFMLHQIRKMIGLIILLIRSDCASSRLPALYDRVRVNIPKAPSLGLLLMEPLFDAYNSRVSQNEKSPAAPLDFSNLNTKIDSFKNDFIYREIISSEVAENTFAHWIRCICDHVEEYGFLNPSGMHKRYYDMAYVGSYETEKAQEKVMKRKLDKEEWMSRKIHPDAKP